MFESDDFDQVLSQFDFPEVDSAKPQEVGISSTGSGSPDFIACTNVSTVAIAKNLQPISKVGENKVIATSNSDKKQQQQFTLKAVHCSSTPIREQSRSTIEISSIPNPTTKANEESYNPPKVDCLVSPKHLKRKIINSHFDQQSKRKFPGPAGLLTGVLEESKDESIGQIEFLSQDMDFTESNLRRDLFESPLWKRLLKDTKDWRIQNVDSIKDIKQQALSGNLRRKKAKVVTAFVEAVDRSVTDPLIILRDETGSIKCTLHRDAWSIFSSYIVSEYCAIVLQKPTVLTTGGAFKKHYLNITLANILAIFSSAVLEEEKLLPDGYRIICKEDFTVIKAETCSENIEPPMDSSNGDDLFDGLDNFFLDDLF